MNIFSKNRVPKVHFSNYNLTHEWKGSFNMGYLVPIAVQDCLPNDFIQGNVEAFIRFAPLKFPIFHRVNCKIYHFFVPNRILWSKWEKFIAEASNDSLPVKPTFKLGDLMSHFQNSEVKNNRYNVIYGVGSLCDYFGLPSTKLWLNGAYVYPSNKPDPTNIDALPFLAYQKIWNDYFRDQNLMEDLFGDEDDDFEMNLNVLKDFEGDIPDNFESQTGFDGLLSWDCLKTLLKLRKKCWEKDYFTSALPDPQFGDPIPVPIRGSLEPNGLISGSQSTNKQYNFTFNGSGSANGSPVMSNTSGTSYQMMSANSQGSSDYFSHSHLLDNSKIANAVSENVSIDNLYFTVEDLRVASALQQMTELLERAGHRYKEMIIAFFNQVTPDFRLDRPEFLGSCSIPVQVSDVPQTSQTTDSSAQGTLAAKGTVYGDDNYFAYHCTEHGWFITLACVLPRTSYFGGIDRKFTRDTRLDYYFPTFEHLGEQAILNREVLWSWEDNNRHPLAEWGYTPRYAEYKYVPSTTHGEFNTSLNFMHLGRVPYFIENSGTHQPIPPLNADFVTVDEETCNRAFAITDEGYVHHLYGEFVHNWKWRRPMQKNPIPKLV